MGSARHELPGREVTVPAAPAAVVQDGRRAGGRCRDSIPPPATALAVPPTLKLQRAEVTTPWAHEVEPVRHSVVVRWVVAADPELERAALLGIHRRHDVVNKNRLHGSAQHAKPKPSTKPTQELMIEALTTGVKLTHIATRPCLTLSLASVHTLMRAASMPGRAAG